MPKWDRTEETVTLTKYTVSAPWPQGADLSVLREALESARSESRRQNGGDPSSDDAIRIHASGGKIVISFEKKEASVKPPPWGAAAHS